MGGATSRQLGRAGERGGRREGRRKGKEDRRMGRRRRRRGVLRREMVTRGKDKIHKFVFAVYSIVMRVQFLALYT